MSRKQISIIIKTRHTHTSFLPAHRTKAKSSHPKTTIDLFSNNDNKNRVLFFSKQKRSANAKWGRAKERGKRRTREWRWVGQKVRVRERGERGKRGMKAIKRKSKPAKLGSIWRNAISIISHVILWAQQINQSLAQKHAKPAYTHTNACINWNTQTISQQKNTSNARVGGGAEGHTQLTRRVWMRCTEACSPCERMRERVHVCLYSLCACVFLCVWRADEKRWCVCASCSWIMYQRDFSVCVCVCVQLVKCVVHRVRSVCVGPFFWLCHQGYAHSVHTCTHNTCTHTS